jgi:hypothetical protein
LENPTEHFETQEIKVEPDAIALMCSMMEVDPYKLPSIQQVKELKWMQRPTASQSEVKDYYY